MTANQKSAVRVAIYARVSSEQQAQEQTISSQVAALRQRIAADGWELPDELCFLDDGVSGSTLMRPALERLRDAAYIGGFQKLYVHSPDRLARRYAYQVLLVDELTKHSVEIVFLNRAIGVSPEEDLLCRCKACSPSTNGPRSWNAVVAASVTPRRAAALMFFPERRTVIAMSPNATDKGKHRTSSTTSKRPWSNRSSRG